MTRHSCGIGEKRGIGMVRFCAYTAVLLFGLKSFRFPLTIHDDFIVVMLMVVWFWFEFVLHCTARSSVSDVQLYQR